MKLSNHNKTKLETLGIIILENESKCILLKKLGINGNRLPNYESMPIISFNESAEITEELKSDCPIMQLWFNENHFLLSCWSWVPGPGPGDFEKEFISEDELVEFIISYYFGVNEYFEERKKYQEDK